MESLRNLGAEIVTAPLDDEPALTRALEGADGFYALVPEEAGLPDFHGRRRRIVEGIARAAVGVPHVVLLSAAAASVADENGPARELHQAEAALRAVTKLTAIRASWFQENVAMALAPARHQGVYPSFLPADVAFPTVATRDVGKQAARCLVEPPVTSEVIDLVGPVYSTRELAAHLGRALGKTLEVVEILPAAHLSALLQAGLPPELAQALVEMMACFASGRIQPRGDRMLAGRDHGCRDPARARRSCAVITDSAKCSVYREISRARAAPPSDRWRPPTGGTMLQLPQVRSSSCTRPRTISPSRFARRWCNFSTRAWPTRSICRRR